MNDKLPHSENASVANNEYYVHPHITSVATNLKVIGALFALTLLTVIAYTFRLGEWNLAVNHQ